MVDPTEWDGRQAAPKGLFRVIGVDKGSWPWEDYWAGDYESYEEAKGAARNNAGDMNPVTVYDDAGNAKFFGS